MLKKCTDCSEEKDITLFASSGKKNKYRSKCKKCYNKRHKELAEKRGSGLEYHLKSRFGISLDDYNLMLEEQNNCCAICNKHVETLRRRLCVDHDHSSGQVRRLLCDPCNTALGLVQENEEILVSMLSYLKEFKNGT